MSIGLREESASAVATPAVGKQTLFIDISDGLVKKKLPDGAIEVVEASAFGVASFNGRVGAVAPSAADYTAGQVVNVPAGNISATDTQNAIDQLDSIKLTTAHQGAGGSVHPTASSAEAGFMAPADKIKLDSLSASGAVSSVFGRTGAIIQVAGDYAASAISVTPVGDIIATNVQAAIQELDTKKAPIGHVGSQGVSQHGIATGADAGFMSPTDKSKLDSVAASATLNSSDAFLLARANHTGVQLASTISDFAAAASTQIAIQAAPIGHVGSGGVQHDVATISLAGFMSAADKTKLDAVAPSATLNQTDAFLLARANHTGVQTASTISDFASAATAAVVIDSIADGDTTHAPSRNAVFDYVGQYLPLAGGNLSGPLEVEGDGAGTGYVDYLPQSSDPVSPVQGVRVFADQDANPSFKKAGQQKFSFNPDTLGDERVYIMPDANVTLMGNPMSASGDLIYGSTGGTPVRLAAGSEGQIFRIISGLPAWDDENLGQDFGDGKLGDLTLSGALTLTSMAFYNTLTLTTGAALTTNGYPLYCKTLDLSNAPVAAIRWNGNNGVSSATQSGGSGGTALTGNILAGAGAGTAGATGVVGAGVQATAPGNITPGNGGVGGAGGGSGSGVNGGASGRSAPTITNRVLFGRLETAFLRAALSIQGGAGGAGGSSGGGDGVTVTNATGGGGGGSAGGVIAIYANRIITSASTPAGVIQAIGGNGGNGRTAPNAGTGGGGGGAGGGGGYIFLAWNTKEGPVISSLVQATGGNGGNGGNSVTGTGGAGGSGGQAGYIDAIDFGNLIGQHIGGAAGTAGSLQSGTTGGTGGPGGLANLTL